MTMTAVEEILRMPLRDKILAAEAIWADICREQQSEDIPEWHRDVLDARSQRIADGSAKFLDWEEAKRQIRSKLR